jgi:hypothetical protein
MFGIGQIVDRHHVEVTMQFRYPRDNPADTAKTIDCNLGNCHGAAPLHWVAY